MAHRFVSRVLFRYSHSHNLDVSHDWILNNEAIYNPKYVLLAITTTAHIEKQGCYKVITTLCYTTLKQL